jgi:hypothetical protein
MKGEDIFERFRNISRRHFLIGSAAGLGAAALGSMLGSCSADDTTRLNLVTDPMAPKPPHFPGKAKRADPSGLPMSPER